VAASCYHAMCAQFIRTSGNTKLFALQGLFNTALVIGFNVLFLAVFSLGVAGYVLSVAAVNLICTIFLGLERETVAAACAPSQRYACPADAPLQHSADSHHCVLVDY